VSNSLSQLCQAITQHYSLEELRSLCFTLGVDDDELRQHLTIPPKDFNLTSHKYYFNYSSD